MLFETIRLAVRAIRRNAVRSFLTVLGVVIGVAAVIAMVTIGNGATASITAELTSLGNNMLFIQPGRDGPGGPRSDVRSFEMADVLAIRAEVPGLRAVAPMAQTSATLVAGSESRTTSVTGTDAGYLIVQDWVLSSGRGFTDQDERAGRAVCILGETVRAQLFGSLDPVGEPVRVNAVSCQVIGVLEAKGQSTMGSDRDDVVLMPIRALQRRLTGNTRVATILVSAEDGVDTAEVQRTLASLMRERRAITDGKIDDFSVRDMRQLVQTMTATTNVLTGLLGAVAAVSLLVGGIGIMNIMLVSVTERTREIGIRLAIGAREEQVLAQFLVEALVLSLFGGLLGIALGLALALATTLGLGLSFAVDPTIVAVAFVFSALIGIVFGYVPARRAARLDPIDALRHE